MNPVCGIVLVTVTRVVLPPFVFGEVEELTDIIGASESCAQPLILACCVQSPASGVVLQIKINNLGFWEFTHPETSCTWEV